MTTDTFDIERHAVRAILLTPTHEVLLMRIVNPLTSGAFWIAPGGGLEPGETVEEGIRRELREELDLKEFAIGPLVWLRRHTFDWIDKRLRQNERYYVVHVDRFAPVINDEHEAAYLDRFQWWHVDELATSTERLTPLSLATIVRRYLDDGPPREEALEIEVLID